jgi:hypothetical protein
MKPVLNVDDDLNVCLSRVREVSSFVPLLNSTWLIVNHKLKSIVYEI